MPKSELRNVYNFYELSKKRVLVLQRLDPHTHEPVDPRDLRTYRATRNLRGPVKLWLGSIIVATPATMANILEGGNAIEVGPMPWATEPPKANARR